jgi:hypothetical protein
LVIRIGSPLLNGTHEAYAVLVCGDSGEQQEVVEVEMIFMEEKKVLLRLRMELLGKYLLIIISNGTKKVILRHDSFSTQEHLYEF